MKKARWHYVDGARSTAPYSLAELHHLQAQGRVTAQTLVWCEGMPGWQPLAELERVAPAAAMAGNGAPNDPYRAPATSLAPSVTTADASHPLPDRAADYAAFVGDNFPVYRQRWKLDTGVGSAGGTWHWPAFLFGVVWIMYRKMYDTAAIWLGLTVIISLIERLLDVPASLSLLVTLVISVIMGVCGNGWYLEHCQREIARVCPANGNSDTRMRRELAERGGTSIGSALAAIGLAVVFSVLAAVLEG